jgi:hypothetical protein
LVVPDPLCLNEKEFGRWLRRQERKKRNGLATHRGPRLDTRPAGLLSLLRQLKQKRGITDLGIPVYSEEDYAQIASAIGKTAADVKRHGRAFEAAAMWFRLSKANARIQRSRPSDLQKRMNQIAAAARKLLRHLGVFSHQDAVDGPGGVELLEALTSAGVAREVEIIRAVEQIGLLEEIFMGREAASILDWSARNAADNAVKMSKLSVPKGRRGDREVNVWAADMMEVYKRITGKTPRVSVCPTGPMQGEPTGPLVRFLLAAIEPLRRRDKSIRLTSLRERVRELAKSGRRQN